MTAKKSTAKNTTRSGRRPTGRDKPTGRGGAKKPGPTPQQAYARHLASRPDGLTWYHTLGGLALDCCPTGTEGRTRKLEELVAAHPGVTLSNLYRAMKFANQYRRADAARLARAGVGWDKVCHLLTLNKADRLKAEAELTRVRMADLRDRVREALAGEMARAVAEAVREVVATALRGGATTAPLPTDVRPARARGRWADPAPDPWDDRPDWARDDSDDDDRDTVAYGATFPDAATETDLHAPAPPAGPPAAPAAVAAGVTAGRWWLRRRGSVVEAVAVGVLVTLAVLAGGPAALAGAAVVTAAADLTAVADALGSGAARFDQL